MIRVIMGDKGSGKTKRLIDMTNEALKSEHGNIIFIDDDNEILDETGEFHTLKELYNAVKNYKF